MRSSLLRGRDHLRLGGIDVVAEGHVAAAISLGGAAKTYSHTDPNEDAAAFAEGPGGCLIAVADGHGGFEGSEVALDHILENPAAQWTDERGVSAEAWGRHALAALVDVNAAILQETKAREGKPTRTTLVLAVIRPVEDRIHFAAIGDSHLFCVTRSGIEDLAAEAPSEDAADFLGHGPDSVEGLSKKCVVATRPLADVEALVLVTDGLTERYVGVDHPETDVREVVERARELETPLRPVEVARGILEVALDAHRKHVSGDNVAAAVWVRA